MEICPSHHKRGHILVVKMKMSNGGIKIWYDLLQPSFVIRTTRKVRIVLRPRMSFSLHASILMEQGKNFATRRGLGSQDAVDKNRRTNHTLGGENDK